MHKLRFFPLLLVTLSLGACASSATKTNPSAQSDIIATTATGEPIQHTPSIDRAMERALAQAEASGNKKEILSTLRQVNARNPEDMIVATRYARALREANRTKEAIPVLMPFTTGEVVFEEALTEMAMTHLSLGNFQSAENYANKVLEMNEFNGRAYLALGTAQDAQSKHQAAETSFRKGLEYWDGDAAPIMNNLALNLASQGHLEEALKILEKALEKSPQRMDLERNRRIIATLLETTELQPRVTAPAPTPKAEVKPQANLKPEVDDYYRPPAPPSPKPLINQDFIVNDVVTVAPLNEVTITNDSEQIIEETIQVDTTPNATVTTPSVTSGMKTNIKLRSDKFE